jgi:hypothetical protein
MRIDIIGVVCFVLAILCLFGANIICIFFDYGQIYTKIGMCAALFSCVLFLISLAIAEFNK